MDARRAFEKIVDNFTDFSQHLIVNYKGVVDGQKIPSFHFDHNGNDYHFFGNIAERTITVRADDMMKIIYLEFLTSYNIRDDPNGYCKYIIKYNDKRPFLRVVCESIYEEMIGIEPLYEYVI